MISAKNLIVHVTTVHPRHDARICLKEAATLAANLEADVHLFVQDGLGEDIGPAGLKIVDTGPKLSRLKRMTIGGWRMFRAIMIRKPVIVHFHDPELLPWILPLRLMGINTVYDVHEDVPRQIKHNQKLPAWLRRFIPHVASVVEWLSGKALTRIVAATPEIAARFPRKKTVIVQNYPQLEEFTELRPSPMSKRPLAFAYIGGLTRVRGLFSMIDAVETLDDEQVCLRLAGEFFSDDEFNLASKCAGWRSVKFDGWLDRSGVASMLSRVRAGLVTLMPIRNYIEARPVKLFEYMAAGLPVIASDFPQWRKMLQDNQCSLWVDPCDPGAIASAMKWVLNNPEEAELMGQRGRQAVLTRYNWETESQKLLIMYRELLRSNYKEN